MANHKKLVDDAQIELWNSTLGKRPPAVAEVFILYEAGTPFYWKKGVGDHSPERMHLDHALEHVHVFHKSYDRQVHEELYRDVGETP